MEVREFANERRVTGPSYGFLISWTLGPGDPWALASAGELPWDSSITARLLNLIFQVLRDLENSFVFCPHITSPVKNGFPWLE